MSAFSNIASSWTRFMFVLALAGFWPLAMDCGCSQNKAKPKGGKAAKPPADAKRESSPPSDVVEDQGRIRELIADLDNDNSGKRMAAARALGKARAKAGIAPLEKALDDTNPKLVVIAAWALGKIGDPRSVRPLLTLYGRSEDPDILRAACDGVEAIGKAGIPVIAEVIKTETPRARECCVRALWAMKIPEGFPILIEALKDGDYRVRIAAADSISALGVRKGIPALLASLKEGQEDSLAAVMCALGSFKEPAAFEPILEILRSGNEHNRDFAACALGKFEDPKAVPALIEQLSHPSMRVRQSVAEALGLLKSPDAIDPLILALEDEDPYVRERVLKSLKLITGKSLGEDPQAWKLWRSSKK